MGNCCSCPHKSRKLSHAPYSPNVGQVCSEEPLDSHVNSDLQPISNCRTSPYYSLQYSADDRRFITSQNFALDAHRPNYLSVSSNYHSGGRHSAVAPMEEIQHIAEREPENDATDPSINIRMEAIFVKEKKCGQSWYFELLARMKRYECRRPNTTTEMYLDGSTVSKPDSRATIRAVAVAICLLIRSPGSGASPSEEDLDIFDEALHPMKIEQSPDENPSLPPSLKTVHRFIRKIFQNAQLSPECAIVTMVYLERLLHSCQIYLNVANWKRILLCAILLASKVWDDQAVWNVDYCQILDELKVDDVNELERRFLEIIQFNINVPSRVYTKYYFDIRDLTVCSHEFTRLTVDKARDLEACSHNLLDSNMGLASTSRFRLRRATSVDSYDSSRRSCSFVLP